MLTSCASVLRIGFIAFGAQRRTQINFAAWVPMHWDVFDPEGVKIQDCHVSAGLSAGPAGLFFGTILDSPRTGSCKCFSQMYVDGFAIGSQQVDALFRSVFRCCA